MVYNYSQHFLEMLYNEYDRPPCPIGAARGPGGRRERGPGREGATGHVREPRRDRRGRATVAPFEPTFGDQNSP